MYGSSLSNSSSFSRRPSAVTFVSLFHPLPCLGTRSCHKVRMEEKLFPSFPSPHLLPNESGAKSKPLWQYSPHRCHIQTHAASSSSASSKTAPANGGSTNLAGEKCSPTVCKKRERRGRLCAGYNPAVGGWKEEEGGEEIWGWCKVWTGRRAYTVVSFSPLPFFLSLWVQILVLGSVHSE